MDVINQALLALQGKRYPFTSPIPESDIIEKNPVYDAIRLLFNPESSPAAKVLDGASIPTPTPTPILDQYGFPTKYNTLFQKYFPNQSSLAGAIARQESSLNPAARYQAKDNNIDAIGLMQINLPVHQDEVPGNTYQDKVKNLMNPDVNLQVAQKIYQKAKGFSPWQAYTSGAYKKYMRQ